MQPKSNPQTGKRSNPEITPKELIAKTEANLAKSRELIQPSKKLIEELEPEKRNSTQEVSSVRMICRDLMEWFGIFLLLPAVQRMGGG